MCNERRSDPPAHELQPARPHNSTNIGNLDRLARVDTRTLPRGESPDGARRPIASHIGKGKLRPWSQVFG